MFMRAHNDLPYGVIQDAVEICRVAGVRVIANIAEERSEGGGIVGAAREGGE
jgi:hypothetical protein